MRERSKTSIGDLYGRLTVVSLSGYDKRNRPLWTCKCICGTIKIVAQGDLRAGDTRSCGCLNRDCQKLRSVTHGLTNTRLYKIWENVKSRCTNPNIPAYKDYGGRGILLCAEWFSFNEFHKDMGETYKEHLTLDRINPNGGYNKENCRWIPEEDQIYNKTMLRSNTSGITGVTYCIIRNCWSATWVDFITKKGKKKSFSANKYGYSEAFRMACKVREEMIDKQVENGAPYTEFHGKAKDII